jgi:hypothetical protein
MNGMTMTTHQWKRRLLAAAAAALLVSAAGCETADDPATALVASLPDEALFALALPGDAPEPTPEVGGALDVGQTPLGELVFGARGRATAGLVRMLEHLDTLVALEPVVKRVGLAVWRVPAGVAGATWGLVLAREAADGGRVRIGLWLRPAEAAPWRFVLGGTALDGATRRGTLHANFENDLRPLTRGRVVASWVEGPVEGGRARTLDVVFHDARVDEDGAAVPVTRTFRYAVGPDGGAFSFDGGLLDVHRDPTKDGLERVRARAFWRDDGLLAATFAAVGPEVVADGFRALVGGQCWQASAPGSVTPLFHELVGLLPDEAGRRVLLAEGDRAACPAVTAVLPVVPEAGAAPTDPEVSVELDEGL